jgi:phenylpyruvate tautomerase PptA (4-oxalocrotonate tautomerase family)
MGHALRALGPGGLADKVAQLAGRVARKGIKRPDGTWLNAGALDRGKQLAVVERLTGIAAGAAGGPALSSRTWVLLTGAPDGGWGLAGHADTNEELAGAARAQIASLQAGQPAGQ